MDLLIKGAEMPKSKKPQFYACILALSADGSCEVVFGEKSYPIVEVPAPHGRLIDADRLIAALKNGVYANTFFRTPTLTMRQIEQLIEHQPTIIDAEE